MAKGTFSVTISAPDVKPTLAAFRKLGKEANQELRDASTEIAERLVPKVKAAANNKMRRMVAESTRVNEEAKQAIIDAGGVVRTLTPEQRQAWVEAMKPVWNKFEKDIGKDLMDAALASNEG